MHLEIITLAFAFTSLRDLPPTAYDTVHWTTFIPHVQLIFTLSYNWLPTGQHPNSTPLNIVPPRIIPLQPL